MTPPDPFAKLAELDETSLLRSIVEGTATSTGDRFFRVLVDNLCRALGTMGAWIATFDEEASVLHAVAFQMGGKWVEGFSYSLHGTPCATAIDERRCVHVPERLIELYPDDPGDRPPNAVSYLGVPLFDSSDRVVGQLAVLDDKPMPAEARTLAVFRIFANRAAAELERIHHERTVREREAQLSRLFDSAIDAIVNLDERFQMVSLNPAARGVLGARAATTGGSFLSCLTDDSRARLQATVATLRHTTGGPACLWIPGRLALVLPGDHRFEVEGTLARYAVGEREYVTLIFRSVEDRLEAERKIESLRNETAYLKEELAERSNFGGILGSSPALLQALDDVERVAQLDTTVLLLGETGTGKELFAGSIHAASRRRERPLIRLNCGAIPANLIESELFGHERGAFTGALSRREGRFTLADGGTLLLDEIGELPLELQPKLLRVLQEGEFEPVGSSRTRRVDVRVVAATHRDLTSLAAQGRFREDLFYRLNVFPIRVPPLRERLGDVPLLAQSFLNRFARRMGRTFQPLSAADAERLTRYPWPGNVRELENVIERAVIVSEGGRLDLERALPSVPGRLRHKAPTPAADAIRTLAEMTALERENIVRALERTGYKVSGPGGAAELLAMNPSTLSSRIRALGVERPPPA